MGWRCFLGAGLWLIHFGLCLDEVGPVRDSSPWSSLRTWFPGSHSQVGVASSGPWVSPGGRGRSRALPALQPVAVQCQGDSMVVTVQRDLFGTGRLVLPGDLWLGAAFCSYTSVSVDNTVIFQTALHDCGNTKEVTPKLVIYSSILTYMPTPSSNRVITRTNQMSVLLQCIYPRHANVSSKAIKPTWVPLRTTVFADGMLSFSFRLMTDDWTSYRSTTTFQLGDVFHLEASVDAASHYPLRIYVDSCMASPTVDPDSTLQYDIVSSHGCLVDGKMSESSAFVSPRVQPDKLRFTVDAFRFIGTTNSLIFITCSLRAVPADSAPSPVSKACSYQARRGWSPVEGPSSVCGCCDSGSCASLGGPRALHQDSAPRRFGKRGEPTDEFQVLAVGPLIVLSENDAAGADVPPPDILALSDGEPRSMLGLEPQFLASEVAQEDEHHHIQDSTVDFEMEGKGPPEVINLEVGLNELLSVDHRLMEDIELLEMGAGEEDLVKPPMERYMEDSLVLGSQAKDLEARLQENSQAHIPGPGITPRGNHLNLTPLKLVEKFGIPKNWSKNSPEVLHEHVAHPGSLTLDQPEAHPEGSPRVHIAQLGPLEVMDRTESDPKGHIAQLGPLKVLDVPETDPKGHIVQLGPLKVLDETDPNKLTAQLGHLDKPVTISKVYTAQLGPLKVLDRTETDPQVTNIQLGSLEVKDKPETHPKESNPKLLLNDSQLGPLEVAEDGITLGKKLSEVAESLPDAEGLRSVHGSHTVHSGPVVVVNEKQSSESDVLTTLLNVGPVVDLEKPRPQLDDQRKMLQVVNVGPIVFQDSLITDDTKSTVLNEPYSEALLEVSNRPVGDLPQLDDAVMRMESPATMLGEEPASGPMPQANHLQPLGDPEVTPLLQGIQLQPLLVEETLPPMGEGRAPTKPVGTPVEAEAHWRLVEVMLLTVGGVVLACILVLGGFLVYRKRRHSLI